MALVTAVGGYASVPVEVRQTGAEERAWRSYNALGAQPSYLDNAAYDLKLIANGYGDSKEEVWQAVRENPNLAVIDALAIPTRSGGNFTIGGPEFRAEGLFFEDDEMEPIELEIREPGSGSVANVTGHSGHGRALRPGRADNSPEGDAWTASPRTRRP